MTDDVLMAAVADGVLTDLPAIGLPRPLSRSGRPIPFAVKRDGDRVLWANVDSRLTLLCTLAGRCHVCGNVLPDDQAWAVTNGPGRVVDGWVMHRRCVRLSGAHCPHIARVADVELWCGPVAEDVVRRLRIEALRQLH